MALVIRRKPGEKTVLSRGGLVLAVLEPVGSASRLAVEALGDVRIDRWEHWILRHRCEPYPGLQVDPAAIPQRRVRAT